MKLVEMPKAKPFAGSEKLSDSDEPSSGASSENNAALSHGEMLSHSAALPSNADADSSSGAELPDAAALSIADMKRAQPHTLDWAIYLTLVLLAIVVPYGVGRHIAVHATQSVVQALQYFTPQGIAFMAWLVTVAGFTGLALSVLQPHNWLWRSLFLLGLSAEQLIAGASMLRLDFWNASYVIYGLAASLVNAANIGIMTAGFGVAAFAVLFVGLLVIINKHSPLNVLTQSWAALALFYALEASAIALVAGTGLLSAFAS